MQGWPKYSPELNPQEHVWTQAEPRTRQLETGRDSFEAWEKKVFLAIGHYPSPEKLIGSMARRCQDSRRKDRTALIAEEPCWMNECTFVLEHVLQKRCLALSPKALLVFCFVVYFSCLSMFSGSFLSSTGLWSVLDENDPEENRGPQRGKTNRTQQKKPRNKRKQRSQRQENSRRGYRQQLHS